MRGRKRKLPDDFQPQPWITSDEEDNAVPNEPRQQQGSQGGQGGRGEQLNVQARQRHRTTNHDHNEADAEHGDNEYDGLHDDSLVDGNVDPASPGQADYIPGDGNLGKFKFLIISFFFFFLCCL